MRLRQGKPGGGGRDERLTASVTETFERSPAGGSTPPGKGWSPARSESRVDVGRPRLRSVDNECVGRVMEPRERYPWRPTPSAWRKAASLPCNDLGRATPPGSASGARTQGLPRNLGDLLDSDWIPGVRPPGEQGPEHPLVRGLARGWDANKRDPPAVPPSERNGSEAGRSSRSRSAFTVATKRGNRPEGPRGAREGAGAQHRARER
jgi:hypothetical protein